MGARGVGHIAYLCGIAPPGRGRADQRRAAPTSASSAAARRSRGPRREIIEACPSQARPCCYADDPLVAGLAARTAARGRHLRASRRRPICGSSTCASTSWPGPASRLTPRGRAAPVALRGPRRAQALNAAAAAAVALALGMSAARRSPQALSRRDRAARRCGWRCRPRPTAVVVINDAYNANPESMRAALKSLAAMGAARRDGPAPCSARCCELGEDSAAEHDAIGRLAVRLNIDRTIAVGRGRPARSTWAPARRARGTARRSGSPTSDAAVDAAARRSCGPVTSSWSRPRAASRLERVAQALLESGWRRTHEPHRPGGRDRRRWCPCWARPR